MPVSRKRNRFLSQTAYRLAQRGNPGEILSGNFRLSIPKMDGRKQSADRRPRPASRRAPGAVASDALKCPLTFSRANLPMASNLHDLPDSPCIGVCSTLFDEVCKGCGRTATEVSNWVFLSDDEKRAVWERISREGTAMRFQYDKL